MSREVKRVPVDFDWPLNEVWKGYLSPESLEGKTCPDCYNGQTYAGWWLQHFSQRIEMLAADIRDQELGRPLHPWLANDPYPVTNPTRDGYSGEVYRPSEDILELVNGLTGRDNDDMPFGYLGVGNAIYHAIANAAGVGDGWGVCSTCAGHGTLESYPGQRADAEKWERTEPPAGIGWQIWEGVSEGSPISPVFQHQEELVVWLMGLDYEEWGGPLTRSQAEGLVNAGWAPSGITMGGKQIDGDKMYGSEGELT